MEGKIIRQLSSLNEAVNGVEYATFKDVPYEFRKWVLGHDGHVNTDSLYQQLTKVAKQLKIPDNWKTGRFTSSESKDRYNYAIATEFYLNNKAKEFKILTTVIIGLKDSHTDFVVDSRTKIYNYEVSDKATVLVKAGSKSAFDSSNKLSTRELLPLNKVTAFIKDENARIIANVDPDSDHNKADSELRQAMNNRE